MYVLQRDQQITGPIGAVFAFFADAAHRLFVRRDLKEFFAFQGEKVRAVFLAGQKSQELRKDAPPRSGTGGGSE